MKKILVTITILMFSLLFAYSESSYSMTMHINPYSYQMIGYTDNSPEARSSEIGFGVGTEFYFKRGKNTHIGTEVLYECHSFRDFHDYHDIKVSARIKSLLMPLNKEETVSVNYRCGIGADFVIRDDSDFGCYAMVIVGAEIQRKFSEEASIQAGMDFGFTFQRGSDVLHLMPFIGCTYHFDLGDKR